MALEGALAIGRQADPFEADEVKTRMDRARAEPVTRAAVPDSSLFFKVKSWLTAEEPA
jgi:hypothetical protein